jgi:serine/threonine protein kinase
MNFLKKTKYKFSKKLGEGAYGIVSAYNDRNGKKVAIKVIKDLDNACDSIRILREIKILKFCTKYSHPNILSLIDVNVDNYKKNFRTISIITERGDTDLHELIYRYRKNNVQLGEEHYKFILFQMLSGVKHLHSANIIHRDLKPSNIIINKDSTIKIIDFGLARSYNSTMTEYVVTRWYRAPEVVLSPKKYQHKMDIWAIGCIMVELIIKEPLFPAENYLHLVKLIIDILNVPDDDISIYQYGNRIIKRRKEKLKGELKKKIKKSFSQYFRKKEKKYNYPDDDGPDRIYQPISNTLLELIKSMLTFNYSSRPNSECILNNEYFEEYHYKLKKYKNPPVQFELDIEKENALIESDDLIGIKKLLFFECLNV